MRIDSLPSYLLLPVYSSAVITCLFARPFERFIQRSLSMIIFVQSYESTTLAIEKLLCCCADEGESNQRTSDIHHNLYKHENDRVKVEKKTHS